MKKIWIFAILAAATVSFGACQDVADPEEPAVEEPAVDEPVVKDSYSYTIAVGGDTRALFAGDCIAWEDGDMVSWFTDIEGASPVNMQNDPRTFTIRSSAPLAAGSKVYAYAPAGSTGQSKESVTMSIPAVQDNTGDYDADAMPLVAIPLEITDAMESDTDTPVGEIQFLNLGAMIRYDIFTSDEALGSEIIKSVSFVADSPVAGEFQVDLTGVSAESVPAPAELTYNEVVTYYGKGVGCYRENAVPVYQIIAPGTWSGTITIQTDIATYEYTFAKGIEFPRSVLRPLVIDLASANAVRTPKPTFDSVVEKLTAVQWELKEVMEEGNPVATSAGNKLTFNVDYSLSFDCSANGGKTMDHTWMGDMIDPEAHGAISAMEWCVYSDDEDFYIGISSGYMLVFCQDSEDWGEYRIVQLTDSLLVVVVEAWGEVWSLVFEAAGGTPGPQPETPIEELLTAVQWELKGVQEAGVDVSTTVGNKLTFNTDYSMSFDCSANGGLTMDHTWNGDLIEPDAHGAISSMEWCTYEDSGVNYIGVSSGYMLVFCQDSEDWGAYRIVELTGDKLTVNVDAWDETWTIFFEACQ